MTTGSNVTSGVAPDIYFFDIIPLWLIFLLLIAISLLAMEIGRRLGKWGARKKEHEAEGPIGTVVGALLALLAFVIALTFSASGNRFDARKQALLDEVNAIGTAYLRTDLIPESLRTTTRLLLLDYVEIRLGLFRDFGNPAKLHSLETNIETVEDSIWRQAVKVAQYDKDSDIYGLFIDAINHVFDMNTVRVVLGAEYRTPRFIWYALISVSFLAMAAVGYQFGIRGRGSLFAGITLSLAFAVVIMLIYDLDRPGRGLIQVNQQPMIELYQSMKG